MHRKGTFRLWSGSSLVSFLCCYLFISGTDYGMRGGVMFTQGISYSGSSGLGVVGLFVSFVLIYLSQALIITCVARLLDRSE